jgi:hypothetical protein
VCPALPPGTYFGDIGWVAHDRGDLHQTPDLHTGSAELRLQIPPRQRARWHLDAIRLLRRPTVRCVQWKQSAAVTTTARHLRYGSAFRLALNIFRPTAIIAYCNIEKLPH